MRLILALMLMIAAPAWAAEPPKSFAAAKTLLAQIHEDIGHLETLYCGCPYKRKASGSGGLMDTAKGCPNIVNPDIKRTARTEWEHVVPAWRMGHNLACWKPGIATCVNSKGEAYKGRKCCEDHNPAFRAAHNDPHNIFPANGQLNGDRLNHPYGKFEGPGMRTYGACEFKVGGSPKRAQYSKAVKGDVARAILYMAEKHSITVPYDRDQLTKDSAEDPPEIWEINRAKAIREKTGLRNRFILGDCDGAVTMRCE